VPSTQVLLAGQLTPPQLSTQVWPRKSGVGLHSWLAGHVPATQGASTQAPPLQALLQPWQSTFQQPASPTHFPFCDPVSAQTWPAAQTTPSQGALQPLWHLHWQVGSFSQELALSAAGWQSTLPLASSSVLLEQSPPQRPAQSGTQ